MCGRFTLSVKVDELPETFGLPGLLPDPPDADMALPRFNVAPTQPIPISRRQPDGTRALSWARWGLIPPRAKDPRVGARMINARAETVFEQPAFRGPVRNQRCLVPTDGFIEWKKFGKRKQPYHVRRPDRGVYAMAGIWTTWQNPGGAPVDTCAVLTTAPNETLAELHDRMPVILPESAFEMWLDPEVTAPEALQPLLRAAPEALLELVPLAPTVNSVKNLGPACLVEIDEAAAASPEVPEAPQLGFEF